MNTCRATGGATRWVMAAVVVAAIGLGACSGGGVRAGGPNGSDRLLVAGSSTLAPLVAEIANRYEQAGGEVRVDVQTGGSAAGVNQVAGGTADIGMVTAPLYEGVDGILPHVIARDAVAPIVNAQGPVQADGLTREELATIFTGAATEGAAPGLAAGESYVVVGKAAGRGTLQVFAEYLGVEPDDHVVDVVVGDNAQGIQIVSQERSAIAYVSIGVALLAVEEGRPVRLLAVDGVEPTLEHVQDGSFPMMRELELLTSPEPSPEALAFIDYVRSEEHEDVYEQFGFVRAAP